MALVALLGASWAHTEGFDKETVETVALLYHKISGEALDFQTVAGMSEAVRRASNFDRPDAIKAEIERLKSQLAAASPAQEFTIRVSDSISDYNHARGEFSIVLFTPGHFVSVQAFRQEYQLAFVNAEGARAILMPKEEAREFDARFNQTARAVTNEIHFKVVGRGDPAGGITGARVIRAEIISARLLDRSGAIVFEPRISPAHTTAGAAGNTFDLAHADVAGLRVGVKSKDLEATLNRLFGPAVRRAAGKNAERFAGILAVNEMGCLNMPGGRHNPMPGAVCVTAFIDSDDIVRSIRIERVFPWFDAEIFRKALVQKYGAVASAYNGGRVFTLGWGPEVDPSLTYDRSGPKNALTAHYATNDDFRSRGLNRLPQMRVVLALVDAKWASESR